MWGARLLQIYVFRVDLVFKILCSDENGTNSMPPTTHSVVLLGGVFGKNICLILTLINLIIYELLTEYLYLNV